MKILIHTDEYYPTAQACSYRMGALVDAFLEKGNEVTVIASSTNRAIETEAQHREKILYSPAIHMKRKTTWMRLLNNISFGVSSVFTALKVGKIDIVITTSPPPLVSIPGWIIARCKRAKLIYDVRDIWPDVALEMGSFSESSLYCKMFRRITRFMYHHADWITTVSMGKVTKLRQYVAEADSRVDAADKLKLVSNGFDESILNSVLDQNLIDQYHLDDQFTCVYIGNIGLAQGLSSLLEIASKTRYKDVQFLLFGIGAEKELLEQRAEEEHLEQVHFCGVIPHDKVFTLLSKAKLSFIPLKSANMKDSIPTKLYEALGIGCPVLLVAEGDACEIVERTGMGRCVSPSHIDMLQEIFDEMVENYTDYSSYRKRAMDLIRSEYSRQQIAQGFERELHQLLE